jgi:hypothetical protein
MASILNVQLGACSVTYNSIDLGHTKGGAEVSYEPEWSDVSVDKYGNTVVEKYLVGEKFTVKVALAEYTTANLKYSMPSGTFAGAANARVTLGKSAGGQATSYAYQLVLHPLNKGTRAHDIVLHKAVVTSAVLLPHKVDEQKVVEVTFEALLDETKTDGNYLGFIGDSTA